MYVTFAAYTITILYTSRRLKILTKIHLIQCYRIHEALIAMWVRRIKRGITIRSEANLDLEVRSIPLIVDRDSRARKFAFVFVENNRVYIYIYNTLKLLILFLKGINN